MTLFERILLGVALGIGIGNFVGIMWWLQGLSDRVDELIRVVEALP